MSTNTKCISIYIVVGGFVVYLINSALTTVLVPYMELNKDGYLKFIEPIVPNGSFEIVCSEFKTKPEEVKYFHNRSIEERCDNLRLGVFFVFLKIT